MEKWPRVLILRLNFDTFFPRLKEYPILLLWKVPYHHILETLIKFHRLAASPCLFYREVVQDFRVTTIFGRSRDLNRTKA